MQTRIIAIAVILSLAVSQASSAQAAKARVTLELATLEGFPITGAQEWSKLLTSLGITSLRIRSSAGDEPKIEKIGNDKSPSYRVVGLLTATNMLVVPGGKFSPRDAGAIRKWLDSLADEGEAAVTERRSAFGLLGKQLEAVHNDLKQPIDFATRDMPLADAIQKLDDRLTIPIVVDKSLQPDIDAVKLEDNLTGLSSGTALAAMLRPAGLVLTPERPTGGELQYRIAKPVAGRESWPIGWPPTKKPIDVLPALYEFINVEISDIPVQKAVDALAGALKVPFLYDRNAMAWHEIDLNETMAAVPSKRSTYSLVLQKVLMQAKMKPELRLDEADKPFYWITSLKPIGK